MDLIKFLNGQADYWQKVADYYKPKDNPPTPPPKEQPPNSVELKVINLLVEKQFLLEQLTDLMEDIKSSYKKSKQTKTKKQVISINKRLEKIESELEKIKEKYQVNEDININEYL